MVLSEHGTVISILREVFEDVEKAPFNVWMSSFIVLNSVFNSRQYEILITFNAWFQCGKIEF